MKIGSDFSSDIPEFLIDFDSPTPKRGLKIYQAHYSSLVELEREAEMEMYEREMRKHSGREREDKGRAILNMRGRKAGKGFGGIMVKFVMMRDGWELPETEIGVGDLVMVSKRDPLREDNPTGTVAEKTRFSLTVVFDRRPHKFVYGGDLRLDLYVNDITYQRMLDAIRRFKRGSRIEKLRRILLGLQRPTSGERFKGVKFHDQSLNESQKSAVIKSLSANHLFLIHGPPGTGKTTTLIEVIRQHKERGCKVLVCADSNIAVDNIVEFLVEGGVNALRVGHPARVVKSIRKHTLDYVILEHPDYIRSEELRDEAFALKDEQEEYTYPHQKYRRGLSDRKIKKLSRRGGSSRGISPDIIREMAEWIKLQEKADRLFAKADRLKEIAINNLLNRADVICTTNSTTGSEILNGRVFDVLVLDEATQATEPSCLVPLIHCGKVIMAGDHLQLPPTIMSLEAENLGLGLTMFERMVMLYGDEVKEMLTVQYRMHENIMNFSNGAFYNGALTADKSVIHHTLGDFNISSDGIEKRLWKIINPDEPVVFVDTTEIEAGERRRADSTSRENPEEAQLVSDIAGSLLKAGIDAGKVAIISPYKDQVDLISSRIDEEDMEVKTVDGFQGREKEAIIISLVRSNLQGELGFLTDVRRLNVSLTRARRKLIVVGDSSTLENIEVYEDFIDYVDEIGEHIIL